MTYEKTWIHSNDRRESSQLWFYRRVSEIYNIREIVFDRWRAVQMVKNLEGMGFTVVPFRKGFKDMSPPTK